MPTVYKKIHRGDFRCPSWFSSDARRVVTRLIDPNPSTRITVAKLVETLWFKKSPISRPVAAPLVMAKDEKGMDEEEEEEEEEEEPKRLNAFHLISLSESFDLSSLFEQSGGRREEGMWFTTKEPASGVISRLEGVATRAARRYRATKSGPTRVRLKGEELGRKGRLVVAAEIFAVALSVLVVVIRKDAGDTLLHQRAPPCPSGHRLGRLQLPDHHRRLIKTLMGQHGPSPYGPCRAGTRAMPVHALMGRAGLGPWA